MTDTLLASLLDALLLAVLGVAGTAIGLLGAWIRRKMQGTKYENTAQLLGVLENIASTTVQALNQKVVDELKKNGEWNKEKAIEVRDAAIANVQRQVTPQVQKLLAQAGLDLGDYVANLIESRVRGDKK